MLPYVNMYHSGGQDMDSKPDLDKLFPRIQHLPGDCVATGMIIRAESIAGCIGSLDDVEAEMGRDIYAEVQSCMAGNCPTNGKTCKGQRLADVPIKMTMNPNFDPYYVKWDSTTLARYFAERSIEKS